MDQESSISIPAQLNLFQMVSIPPFQNSQERKDAVQLTRQNRIKKVITLLILWSALFFIVPYMFSEMVFFGHTLVAIVVALFGGGMLLGFSFPSRYYNNTLQKAKEEHCRKVIEELVNRYFPGTVYFYYEENGLIYNNDIFAYVSTKTGQLVIYNRENIAKFGAEMVTTNKMGFVTRTDNYGSTTIRQGYMEEYIIKITTNFLACPIVLINVGKTRFFEDEINKVMAVLGVSN
jgi:hypothetical protein